MPRFQREHIVFANRTQRLPYTSNTLGRSNLIPRTGVNRIEHGGYILGNFNAAIENFRPEEDMDFVYLVFRSARDFLLDLDKFDLKDFRVASYKEVKVSDENTTHYYYECTVYLNKKAISKFLRKVEDYLQTDTPIRYNEDGSIRSGGNPRNQLLISNIQEIRAATLESFWQEPELPFPNADEEVWWEVWLARSTDNADDPIEGIRNRLQDAHIQIGDSFLKFPEHCVYLLRGTVEQLGSTILYTDKLAELRQPKDTAEFFSYLDIQEQNEWINNLNGRIDQHTSTVSVCLLDTGVNRNNPLLENLIPPRHLDSVRPDWTTADTHPQGHGTPMAGLILYGDLTEALASTARIQLYHQLESIKLLHYAAPHDPMLYGAVTQEAVARGEIINPHHKRIICMAITCEHLDKGRPSSWSSAIDQTIYGSAEVPNSKLLFFISAGNTYSEEWINYPLANDESSIQDPAQSFNAITVGAYSLKDQIDFNRHPGATLLAPRGAIGSCSKTSVSWDNEWCRKPDVVMEGGNKALLNGDVIEADSLQLLTTSKGGIGRSHLTLFSDTSASTALAAKFSAELYHHYPNLWPETIRGLIIHSADWTTAMLGGRTINHLPLDEKIKLISRVGYGVPNMQRARFSANNSLSLIAERTLKPFKKEKSKIKTNEFHLFDLPWPRNILQELPIGTLVSLKVTLSYFIEPNPGNQKYDLAASYRSCGLRFKMIGPNESDNAFKGRVSKAVREEDYRAEAGENWVLGATVRNKGSVHKDIWEGTAADLATRNKIAVYPVGGWWKTRKGLDRFDNSVRYSLIITIETPDINVDIYTPVMNQIAIPIQT